ncbi:hypothetical protein V6N13_113545 [Hibiscus sabdariffa]
MTEGITIIFSYNIWKRQHQIVIDQRVARQWSNGVQFVGERRKRGLSSTISGERGFRDNKMNRKVNRESKKMKESGKVVDSRSYKEALLGNIIGVNAQRPQEAEVELGHVAHEKEVVGNAAHVNVEVCKADQGCELVPGVSVNELEVMKSVSPLVMALNKKDKEWLNNCLIVLKFDEEEQIDIFWELKDTILKPWFSDIDTVANFMEAKKLLIKRLDVARILIGVKCLSVIPHFLHIKVEGAVVCLRIETSEFEDNHRWIDDENLNGCFECVEKEPTVDSKILDNELNSPRLENDFNAGLENGILADNEVSVAIRDDSKVRANSYNGLEDFPRLNPEIVHEAVASEKLFQVYVDAASVIGP